MEIEKIKESVSQILDFGGRVYFSCKNSIDSWYYDCSMSYDKEDEEYNIHNGSFDGSYKDKEEAIDKFVRFIFSENNIGYCIERLVKRVDFDVEDYDFERPTTELIELIEEEKKLIIAELNNQNIYLTGHAIVNKILTEKLKNKNEDLSIEKTIVDSLYGVDLNQKRQYLSHLNTLYLNVLLNRLNELGSKAEPIAFEAREVISNLIRKFDEKNN